MPFVVSNTGLEMPDDFPVTYEVVNAEARKRQWPSEVNREFAGGWNAVGWRFKATCEHADSVERSIADFGPAPAPEERWRQEMHIFGFFMNGLAVLESTLYACFGLGHLSKPQDFPFTTAQHRRNVTPSSVVSAFESAFPLHALTAAMRVTLADPQYTDWRDIRNVLSHRQAPGRHHFMSSQEGTVVGAPQHFTLVRDFATTRRAQLAALLTRLVDEVPAFLTGEVP